MPVDYGLLSANLNLPIEQMVSINNQNQQARAQMGLQAAQMRSQEQMQAAQLAQRRIEAANAANTQAQMQAEELRVKQAMQDRSLAAQLASERLPYEQATVGQQIQLMGYQDAEKERQARHRQEQLDYERQLANDAAKQKWEMMKLQYDQMSPKSAEAKFAHDLVNETNPAIKQMMLDQRAMAAARNNQTVTYGKDANGNVTVSVAKGGTGIAGTSQAFNNKAQEENLGNKIALSDLQSIRSSWKPEFSTTGGQLKYDAVLKAERLGLPLVVFDKATIEDAHKYAAWTQQVEQSFNQYRKEITGAGASNVELEKLAKAYINTGQGPEEFMASMAQAEAKMQRYIAVREKAVNAGLIPNTPAFASYIDKSAWYVNTPSDHANALKRFEVK